MTQCFNPRWIGADSVSVPSTARLPEPGRYNDYGRLSALGCGRRDLGEPSRSTSGAQEPPIGQTMVPRGRTLPATKCPFLPQTPHSRSCPKRRRIFNLSQ